MGRLLLDPPIHPDRADGHPPDQDPLQLMGGLDLRLEGGESAFDLRGILVRQDDSRPGHSMLESIHE
jgi:hypothetical protein